MTVSALVKADSVGRVTIGSNELFELIYQDNYRLLSITPDTGILKFRDLCKEYNVNFNYKLKDTSTMSDQEYKEYCVSTWSMPDSYNNIDLDKYFADKITTIEQAERVSLELVMFEERGLQIVLRFIIYLVDTMREHNIVWGVGRGSSIASYCLYLIGLHKIDSIKYQLDIKEFLK